MAQDDKTRIEKNLTKIKENIKQTARSVGRSPMEVMLLPVTKRRGPEEIQILQELGFNTFGESYTEELVKRFDEVPYMNWHFIGHLHRKHTNKIVGNVDIIHSVANERILEKIDFTAGQKGTKQDILLEVNTSGEPEKQGFTIKEAKRLYSTRVLKVMPSINILGLMTMAPNTDDQDLIRTTFQRLRGLLKELNRDFNADLSDLSMGMTNDYQIAIEEGATIVRIGTAIFE